MFMGKWEYYRLALSLYCMGRARNYFYLFIFPVERAYTPDIFGCAFCRIMQSREWSASQ